jgi:uncharacterized protein (TIGR01440 family)
MSHQHAIADTVETIVQEVVKAGKVTEGQILVIGASTSEVAGKPIGTAGAWHIAQEIFEGIERVRAQAGFRIAFQCCEHLNRALVVERDLLRAYPLEEVSVIPVSKAGGAMAAFAYRHLAHPCVVESVQAHAGIDIGDTLIGMHLRKVAVPFRPSLRQVGEAHVNTAYTRPKLVGGARAVYTLEDAAVNEGTKEDTSC